MIISTLRRLGAVSAVLSFVAFTASAELVTNGGFDTGDLTGWTAFVTANGTSGSGLPAVSVFDLGSGASNAAQFDVGAVTCCTLAGGGISQTITAPEDGTYQFTAQIASLDDPDGEVNGDGGTFSILVDGVAVATDSLGAFSSPHQVIDGSLDGSEALTAGAHTLQIQIVRPFTSGGDATPQEFVDNISANETASATPEPCSMSLLAAGGVALIGLLRRRQKLSV